MPVKKSVLFVRPDFDLATNYVSSWLSETMQQAKSLGWSVSDIYGEDVIPENVLNTIRSTDSEFIVGTGHGIENQWAGQNNEIVLNACQNDGEMKERYVYLASCLTGINLGPSMIRKGGQSYAGYNDFLYWVVTPPYNPSNDLRARGFKEAVNAFTITLLQGGTVPQAYYSSIVKYNEWIAYWRKSTDLVAGQIIALLISDRDALITLGTNDGMIAPLVEFQEIPQGMMVTSDTVKPNLLPAIISVVMSSMLFFWQWEQ